MYPIWYHLHRGNLRRSLLALCFHGSTVNRAYSQRWKLLGRTGFDPDLDLKRDWQGLWQLTDHNPELRDGLRAYARLRDEDSPGTRGIIQAMRQ
jgi:hypothetical protein